MTTLLHGTAADAGAARLVAWLERGYVLQVEERWEREGQQWYCREVFLCDLDAEGRIVEMGYHCTGEWDEARVAEHAEVVTLVRP